MINTWTRKAISLTVFKLGGSMTVTKTVYGSYQVLSSDASGAATIAKELAQALNTEKVPKGKVVYFNATEGVAVYHV